MPAWVVPAVGAALSFALSRRKSRGIQGRVRALGDRYRAERPVGWTTPEDETYFAKRGEYQRERSSRAIGALGQQQRGAATARMVARGLGYSPAAEYLQSEASQGEAERLSDVNRDVAEFQEKGLYDLRNRREGFEQQRLMTAWGAELGALKSDRDAQDAQQAAFWNSIMPVVQGASSWFGGGQGGNVSPEDWERYGVRPEYDWTPED